jgi:hypothetical protein
MCQYTITSFVFLIQHLLLINKNQLKIKLEIFPILHYFKLKITYQHNNVRLTLGNEYRYVLAFLRFL